MKRCLLSLFAVLALAVPAWAQGKKVNIIAIVTDDQARWGVGAYGNPDIKTPNMDRLAREGAQFMNAFVATPVCSPSRASFLTGKYGTQVGIHDWINPMEAKSGLGLPASALTWVEVLKKHGYATALFGKWHLGMLGQFHPTRRGYDHFFGFVGGGNQPINPTLEKDGKEQKLTGSLPDLLVDETIAFIKKNREGPFAVSLHFRAPHTPYAPVPEADSKPFAGLDPKVPSFPDLDVQKAKKLTRDYYGSIHSIDRNLGRLLAALEELGLLENTIILFTSDHGYNIGQHGIWHKGNGTWLTVARMGQRRPNMFETSLAVPLILRGPGIRRGKVDALVSNIDTFATILGLLKVPAPADYRQEGQDFSPLARGENIPWRDAVFAQYDMHTGDKARMRSVRTERFHLIRQYLKNQPDELFDLKSDPDELRNLFDDPNHRTTQNQLQDRLDQWMASIQDPLKK